MSAFSRRTAFRNSSTGTAGPRNTVCQPAASASRKKFITPATWTHLPNAPATTVFIPSPFACVDLCLVVAEGAQGRQDAGVAQPVVYDDLRRQ